MNPRSLLFVPGDRPERMEKALMSGADALILDLEDSVLPAAKDAARAAIVALLSRPRDHGVKLMVRINPLGSEMVKADLATVMPGNPDAIVLPKAEGKASIDDLARRLLFHDANDTPILPIATETPSAIFALGSYGAVSKHLCGLTWGAEDLPAAIGAATSREADGSYTAPYQLARSLTLFAAHAADVAAIETVFPAFRDLEGLAAYARRAARDGFTGMMAIHPAQIATINTAFTPSGAEIARAQAIVAAFDANRGAGALQFEGGMVDAPHLKQAVAILSRAGVRVEPAEPATP